MQQVSTDLFDDIFTLTVPRHLRLFRNNFLEIEEDGKREDIRSIHEEMEILMDFLAREFGTDDDHLQQQAIYPLDDTQEDRTLFEDDDEGPTIVEE